MAPTLLARTRAALDLARRDAPDEVALAKMVSRGLPVRSIEHLIASGLPESELYRFIPRRTLQRRRSSAALLTPEESERVERLASVLALASSVLGEEKTAIEWLRSPKERFDGERPIDLLVSHTGARLVEEALFQAYYGNVA